MKRRIIPKQDLINYIAQSNNNYITINVIKYFFMMYGQDINIEEEFKVDINGVENG